MRRLLFLCATAILVSACSNESVKRTTYGTLQNIEKQQCQKDLSRECPDQDSYDEYQRKRTE